MAGDPVETVRAKLEQHGFDPRPTTDGGWESRCPGHQGRRRNLSLHRGDDGRALLHCHHSEACSLEKILSPVGLTTADLFPEQAEQRTRPKRKRAERKPPAAPRKNTRAYQTFELAFASLKGKFGRLVDSWPYHDVDEHEVLRVGRFEGPDGKTYRPAHPDVDGWHLSDPPGPLPLYRLPELAASPTAYVVEGEKCAELLRNHGIVATTSAHGAGSARKTDWTPLSGKTVIIVPDRGQAGEDYARSVVEILAGLELRPTVKVVRLDLKNDGDDVEQWLATTSGTDEQIREQLAGLAAAVETEVLDAPAPAQGSNGKPSGDGERGTQAETLMRLAARVQLFHTPEGTPYGSFPVNGHRETYRLGAPPSRRWLMREFYQHHGRSPSSDALQSAIGILEAVSIYDSPAEPVHVRVAGLEGSVFIDLANDRHEVVEVNPAGWRVVRDAPVRFRRAKGMLPLPVPSSGGMLEELRPFLNVGTDDDWRMIVAFVTSAFRPAGPYPLLTMAGEQGSAKSTTTRILRRLVDPSITPLRSEPRDARDLMIAAHNAWTITLDNLSHLHGWLSDALCRLATGGGFATRALYENDEEMHFEATRPVLLNGIEDLATRFDLLDRAIVLHLPAIPEQKRREEGPLWSAFDAAHPRIFGALLDAVAGGLRELPSVRLDRLPRMADFARWGEAVGRAAGWSPGAFLAAYQINRDAANDEALEASPVGLAVRDFASEGDAWIGTASELLKHLNAQVGEDVREAKGWPSTAHGLSGKLRRCAPALRKAGVDVSFPERTKRERKITIERFGPNAERHPGPSERHQASPDQGGLF